MQVEHLDSKATLAEVRCSGCGGPVDITHDVVCGYCRAPLSVLDAQAVEKALAGLGERQAHGSDPVQVAAAIRQAMLEEPVRAREREHAASRLRGDTSPEVSIDLVTWGIAALVGSLQK
jgi:hypothetical protein